MVFKKLLIIGFVWPEPKSSAAGSRMLQLIALFQQANYSITFATPCVKSENAFNLTSIGVAQVAIELNNSSFDEFIKNLNPEVVLFDRFMMEEQFGWRVAENCPNALRILDTEDLHFLRKARQNAFKANQVATASFLNSNTAKREIASIYRCDLSLIISEAEINLLVNHFKIDQNLLHYLPFMLDTSTNGFPKKMPAFNKRNHFITIGNFLHEPNYNAVLYLKETIWPQIKKQLPKAKMQVYGAYASEKVKQLENKKEGFLIMGFAPDANIVMQQARVCLAPLRFGAGLKGKIVEAMQNGTPCVTTSIGAEGIYGNLEPNGFICDTPTEFSNKAVMLYQNEILWKEKQSFGFEGIKKRFNKATIQQKFLNRLDKIIKHLEPNRQNNFIGLMLMHHTMQSTKYMSKWIAEKNKFK